MAGRIGSARMVLLKVDLACTFAARFARPDVLEVEAVHGSRMCASTEAVLYM